MAVPKTAPDCASYRSYRGIGRARNYAEARECAWQERLAQKADLGHNQKQPIAWVVGGSLILADIYFNGAGVQRNLPLAMRLACEAEEGMAELAAPEIAKLDLSAPSREPFEFCKYAVTTFTMNFCSAYASEMEDEGRGRYFNSLKSSMTQKQLAAFEELLTAQKVYVDAHSLEVYQGGTIRNIRTARSQSILNDLFRTHLVQFERKKWPAHSNQQIASADGLLRNEYEKTLKRLQRHTKEELNDGAVAAKDLSAVQSAWLKYRDAWIAFARLRYPDAVAQISTKITLERYRLLRTIS